MYARAVYGARASLLVGALRRPARRHHRAWSVGMLAGYFGGWVDAVLSRVIDIVLGIPLLLAAIVLLKRVASDSQRPGIGAVVFVLGLLGWTTAARVIRSSVITAKQQDYVQAARMLGAGNSRIMWRHILPNSLAPVIVVHDHRAGLVHRRRGDAVLPRHRPAGPRPSPGASTSTPAGIAHARGGHRR